jgi:hypothetical protein
MPVPIVPLNNGSCMEYHFHVLEAPPEIRSNFGPRRLSKRLSRPLFLQCVHEREVIETVFERILKRKPSDSEIHTFLLVYLKCKSNDSSYSRITFEVDIINSLKTSYEYRSTIVVKKKKDMCLPRVGLW